MGKERKVKKVPKRQYLKVYRRGSREGVVLASSPTKTGARKIAEKLRKSRPYKGGGGRRHPSITISKGRMGTQKRVRYIVMKWSRKGSI